MAAMLVGVLGCSGQGPPRERSLTTAAEPAYAPGLPAITPGEAPEEPVETEEVEVDDDPPEPPPFEGLSRVPVSALWTELEAIARSMEGSARVREEYAAFVRAHRLDDTPSLFADYVRVKLVFEATRDGGFWRLRWAITNRAPRSTEIWSQWTGADELDADIPTAVAECDELSALFAVVARRLGVDRIGLMWPVWNHVVAVWTVRGEDGNDVRIVVPTSQIFLDANATLGTDGFNPWKQKTIYTYRSPDVPDRFELPGVLARFFVEQAREHAARSSSDLQRLRNERSARLGGS